MIADKDIDAEINRLLGILYKKRINALGKLTLTQLLNKNPYLYRAIGVVNPPELLEQLLAARISSSDETIFGNSFFEPLAYWAAEKADQHKEKDRKVNTGAGAGQDISIENSLEYLAISVKSGKSIFNSQSDKGQKAEFEQLQARLKKLQKQFRAIIGYGYGRKTEKKASVTEKLAGQAFWKLLTGEDDFYQRISSSIGKCVTEHAKEYEAAYQAKLNILTKNFFLNFVSDDGLIPWEKVVAFNSSSEKPKRLKGQPKKKVAKEQ